MDRPLILYKKNIFVVSSQNPVNLRSMRLFVLVILMAFSSAILGQEPVSKLTVDERLYNVFSESYIEDVKSTNPVLLLRWNFYLDNAFYITTFPNEKGTPDYPVITIPDLNNINILALEKEQSLSRDWNKQSVYQIAGTNEVLVYYSGKKFSALFNKHRSKKSK